MSELPAPVEFGVVVSGAVGSNACLQTLWCSPVLLVVQAVLYCMLALLHAVGRVVPQGPLHCALSIVHWQGARTRTTPPSDHMRPDT